MTANTFYRGATIQHSSFGTPPIPPMPRTTPRFLVSFGLVVFYLLIGVLERTVVCCGWTEQVIPAILTTFWCCTAVRRHYRGVSMTPHSFCGTFPIAIQSPITLRSQVLFCSLRALVVHSRFIY